MKIKDHSISQEIFEIEYISEYDMYQTSPLPDDLGKYYESENYISHTDNSKGIINKLYQWVKEFQLRQKVKLINTYAAHKGKLLEIGAGTGDFLLTAQKNNWEVVGIEPNEVARTNAHKKGIELYQNIENISAQTFDCITLWHSLEHIPHLKEQIQFLENHLNKEGLLVIAVPNHRSWDARHYKEYWAAYDVPRHCWHFSKTSIERLFAEVNMEIIKTYPMWFDAFYVSLLSEKYKNKKSHLVYAFINGVRSNLYGVQKGEFSSQIYLLKKKKRF